MTFPKQPKDRIYDMLVYCRHAQEFLNGVTWEAFQTDAKTQAACLDAVKTIGEAVSHIPLEFRRTHSEIAWTRLKKTRNSLAHGYDSILWDRVWKMILWELPKLETQLEVLLQELAGDPDPEE